MFEQKVAQQEKSELVGYQLSGVHVALSFNPQRSAGRHRLAQVVAGRDGMSSEDWAIFCA